MKLSKPKRVWPGAMASPRKNSLSMTQRCNCRSQRASGLFEAGTINYCLLLNHRDSMSRTALRPPCKLQTHGGQHKAKLNPTVHHVSQRRHRCWAVALRRAANQKPNKSSNTPTDSSPFLMAACLRPSERFTAKRLSTDTIE